MTTIGRFNHNPTEKPKIRPKIRPFDDVPTENPTDIFSGASSWLITIEPSRISILNCPGPDRSISKEDIEKGDMLKSRRYRNRRLGDFLKELDLTENHFESVKKMTRFIAKSTDYSELHQNNNRCQNLDVYNLGT